MLGSKKQGASHQNAFDGRANSNRDQGLLHWSRVEIRRVCGGKNGVINTRY